jgi:hypothetical protein
MITSDVTGVYAFRFVFIMLTKVIVIPVNRIYN